MYGDKQLTSGRGSAATSGRGRGWYYKEKYSGRGRNNSNSQQNFNRNEASIKNENKGYFKAFPITSNSAAQLHAALVAIDGQQYGKLKSLIALEDYLTRSFWKHINSRNLNFANNSGDGTSGWHSNKGADFNIDKPGQQVLERTSMLVNSDFIEARFTLSFPAQGRSILGRQAASLVTDAVIGITDASMKAGSFDLSKVQAFIDGIEDQEHLRAQLAPNGFISFISNGAILPRLSGASDLPMPSVQATPFKSPKSLERSFTAPHAGNVTGMAIPRGVTAIVGGGFHGKTTLLDALQMGVYNHIQGDGRDGVVTDANVVKIRAEDGRSVVGVDVSAFIGDLPGRKSTRIFGTTDASGSTSMAAGITEALEAGCSGFLFDEDTCATNFLIRDERMRLLIPGKKEPITPLICKVRSLYEDLNVSTIIVIGGCGSYLDVADVVISLDEYAPCDATMNAKNIVTILPEPQMQEKMVASHVNSRKFKLPNSTTQMVDNFQQSFSRPPKSATRHTSMITFSGIDVDLSGLEQLVHMSQSRAILDGLLFIRDKMDGKGSISVKEALHELESVWNQNGLDAIAREGLIVGDYARPRALEVAAALNRIRGLCNIHVQTAGVDGVGAKTTVIAAKNFDGTDE
ncbi:hypothetical protein HK100_008324 [Physocladia obscura]|uniref:Uncharacterized protein n=1 Tax=Physocladia obscura TaxID=109957 RepID=A0AAD5XJR8_9FUNG|nr:hypothetical protein HK100_008324 [Physocladia obscura]